MKIYLSYYGHNSLEISLLHGPLGKKKQIILPLPLGKAKNFLNQLRHKYVTTA